MATNPRQDLHDAIDCLNEDEARRLSLSLLAIRASDTVAGPRVLTKSDVILSEPVLPDDETADDMIAAVRRWRRDGGHA